MNVYDFTVQNNRHEEVSLENYRGKVLLIVNTATKCGLTPQYDALEALYKKYRDRGFEVLDFPSNQFLKQAPGTDEEIDSFCTLTFNTSFPRFAKLDVNGKNTAPLFAYLKEQMPTDTENEVSKAFDTKIKLLKPFSGAGDIKWNFGKFLINREGAVVARFSPAYTPEALEAEIEKLL